MAAEPKTPPTSGRPPISMQAGRPSKLSSARTRQELGWRFVNNEQAAVHGGGTGECACNHRAAQGFQRQHGRIGDQTSNSRKSGITSTRRKNAIARENHRLVPPASTTDQLRLRHHGSLSWLLNAFRSGAISTKPPAPSAAIRSNDLQYGDVRFEHRSGIHHRLTGRWPNQTRDSRRRQADHHHHLLTSGRPSRRAEGLPPVRHCWRYRPGAQAFSTTPLVGARRQFSTTLGLAVRQQQRRQRHRSSLTARRTRREAPSPTYTLSGPLDATQPNRSTI